MKKILSICTVLLALSLLGGCWISDYSSFDAEIPERTSAPIDTAYPNDILKAGGKTITVEDAEEYVRTEYGHIDYIRNGNFIFEKLSSQYTGGVKGGYDKRFIFTVQEEKKYCIENYRVYVDYTVVNNSLVFKGVDFDEIEDEFTQMGIWQYDDGETRIWINFIRKDGYGYVVEYEVKFYNSKLLSSGWIEYNTNGEEYAGADNQWDGESYYLSIDLGGFKDENGEFRDCGSICVYPTAGVYWSVDSGEYKLSN